jgi:iron complex outermembrane receptor protein
MNIRIGILLAANFYCSAAMAQQKEITLDPVTITATISPQKISTTGRNVFVIKGEEFNKLPVHSIDDLLKYLPGVEVQMRGPMGSQSDIVLRGGTFQQVLIIIDGLRLNDPNTGHFNSYIPIATSEIDHIEILKGASSAIYGSEAVGGVIQIFSKSFTAKQNQKLKQLQASGTVGEYHLFNGNLGGNFSNGKTFISAGFLSNNADGQAQRGTTGFFHNNTASVSVNHIINEYFHFSLRSSYDKRNFSAQNFYTTFISDTAKEEVQTYWNQIRLAYTKEKNKISLDAGYKEVQDQYSFNSAITPNFNRSTLIQALAVYEHAFTRKSILVSGAQFQNKLIHSNDRGNHSVKQAAVFVMLNKNFGDYFFASPALRIDYDERGGTELVPQINLSYKKQNLQFRGSAGKTIRQANFTERFNNYNKTFVAAGSIGNPDLEAERSFSYEAGTDYFVKNNLKISATIFKKDQNNVIDFTPTPYAQMPRKDNLSPTGKYALASNIATVNTTGIETDIQYTKELQGLQRIFTTIGCVWLNSKTSEIVPSFYISSHAKFLVNFNLQYQNKLGSVSFNGIYKERKPRSASAIFATISKNYFLINVKAEVNVFKNKLSAFAQADNLFNKTYSDILGSQMPGRWLMTGLKLNL